MGWCQGDIHCPQRISFDQQKQQDIHYNLDRHNETKTLIERIGVDSCENWFAVEKIKCEEGMRSTVRRKLNEIVLE